MSANATRRASIIGTGLIGGSVGLALRHLGWHVTGSDADPASAQRALELGAIDAVGLDPLSELSLVAAPVSAISTEVRRALAHTAGVVTDVGSVKASVVAEVDDPRFVGGHPMAGSEQLGVDGASADLFEGAVWVLTPVAGTDPDHFATVDAMAGGALRQPVFFRALNRTRIVNVRRRSQSAVGDRDRA